jgi:hypothetical protein
VPPIRQSVIDSTRLVVIPVACNPCARSGILITDGVLAEPFACTAFVVSGVVD